MEIMTPTKVSKLHKHSCYIDKSFSNCRHNLLIVDYPNSQRNITDTPYSFKVTRIARLVYFTARQNQELQDYIQCVLCTRQLEESFLASP